MRGPDRDVVLTQIHRPGEAIQIDITDCASLGVTVAGELLAHRLCVAVLPHSNWWWPTICASESFAAFRAGLQAALFELGGAPGAVQIDNTQSATHAEGRGRAFNDDWLELLKLYGLEPRRTAVRSPRQNGDVESRKPPRQARDRAGAAAALLARLRLGRRLRPLPPRAGAPRARPARRAARARARRAPGAARAPRARVRRGAARGAAHLHDPRRVEHLLGPLAPDRAPRAGARLRVARRDPLRAARSSSGRPDCSAATRSGSATATSSPRCFGSRAPSSATRTARRCTRRPPSRRAYDVLGARAPSQRAGDLEYLRVLKLAADGSEAEVEAALELILESGAEPSAGAVAALCGGRERPGEPPRLAPYTPDLAEYADFTAQGAA